MTNKKFYYLSECQEFWRLQKELDEASLRDMERKIKAHEEKGKYDYCGDDFFSKKTPNAIAWYHNHMSTEDLIRSYASGKTIFSWADEEISDEDEYDMFLIRECLGYGQYSEDCV